MTGTKTPDADDEVTTATAGADADQAPPERPDHWFAGDCLLTPESDALAELEAELEEVYGFLKELKADPMANAAIVKKIENFLESMEAGDP